MQVVENWEPPEAREHNHVAILHIGINEFRGWLGVWKWRDLII